MVDFRNFYALDIRPVIWYNIHEQNITPINQYHGHKMNTKQSNKKTDKHHAFLSKLNTKGVENMWGSASALALEFSLDYDESWKALYNWMKSSGYKKYHKIG